MKPIKLSVAETGRLITKLLREGVITKEQVKEESLLFNNNLAEKYRNEALQFIIDTRPDYALEEYKEELSEFLNIKLEIENESDIPESEIEAITQTEETELSNDPLSSDTDEETEISDSNFDENEEQLSEIQQFEIKADKVEQDRIKLGLSSIYDSDDPVGLVNEYYEEMITRPDGTEPEQTDEVPEEEPRKIYSDYEELLKDMYEDDDLIKFFKEHDIDITDEKEREKFEKFAQGDEKELTLEALQKIYDSIKDGDFDIDEYLKFKITEPETPESEKPQQNTTSASGGGSGYVGGGGGSVGNVQQNNNRNSNDINQMTLEELKTEQSKRQESYNSAMVDLSEVYSGKNKAVAEAQEKCDTAKNAYLEAMKNESEEAQKLESERSEVQGKIDEQQNAINENTGLKFCCETQKNSNNTQITSLNEQISALEQAKSAWSENSSNNENQDSYNEQRQKAIEAINAQINAAESQIETLKKENETLDEQIKSCEENINNSKTQLEELQTQYQGIVTKLNENISDSTKKLLEEFNSARDNVETIKAQQAKTAQKAIDEQQKSLNEVNQKIIEAQTQQTVTENSYNNPAKAVEYARSLLGKDLSSLVQLLKSSGVCYHEGLYCGDFVYMALKNSLGYENLPDWYKDCHYMSCAGVTAAGKDHKISLNEAQVGDIVIYDWDGDGVGNHVALYTGQDDSGVTTIEGNTEKGPVAELRRKKSQVLAVYSMHN